MGSGNYKIHKDGVIERGDEQEKVLLNILEVGSHKIGVFAAYKAMRKCIKIAKLTRKYDYKEYVERLQLDNYPNDFKKAEIGQKIVMYLYCLPISLGGACLFLILGLDWAFSGSDAGWCVPLTIIFFILLGLNIRYIIKDIKNLKSIK